VLIRITIHSTPSYSNIAVEVHFSGWFLRVLAAILEALDVLPSAAVPDAELGSTSPEEPSDSGEDDDDGDDSDDLDPAAIRRLKANPLPRRLIARTSSESSNNVSNGNREKQNVSI
jgi:hypothetical protein